MKAKNILYIGVSALLALSTFSACGDKLSELPQQYKVDGNVAVDQKTSKTLLNGMYYTYAKAGRDNYDNMSTSCFSTYSVWPSNFAGTIAYYQGSMYEEHGGYYAQSGSDYFWSLYYGTINAANCVIEQVGAVDDSKFEDGVKAGILGEAYGMRALMFYNLLRMFGYSWDTSSPYGILLRTTVSKVSTSSIERTSVKEAYEQILSDVDYAIANAPTENKHCYITKWFAMGLKARVLMLRGEGNDYADAAELAKQVIDQSGFQLADHTEDIFKSSGYEDNEVIFGIAPYDSQIEVYQDFYYYNSPQWIPTDNMLALFENDPRLDTEFADDVMEQYVFTEDAGYTIEEVPCKRLMKFVDKDNDEANTIEESQYDMRLTEMYLLRAEALVRSGGSTTEAKQMLKTVLQHVGYEDTGFVDEATGNDALLKLIFEEDLRNLYLEGGREIDLMLRFGDLATEFNEQYGDKQFNVLAIPTDEFLYNSKLPKDMQNPGFSAE